MSELYLGLLHYPVRNKRGQIITTSVTSLDLHDIARLCATYELPRYYVIQPDESQQRLVQEMCIRDRAMRPLPPCVPAAHR